MKKQLMAAAAAVFTAGSALGLSFSPSRAEAMSTEQRYHESRIIMMTTRPLMRTALLRASKRTFSIFLIYPASYE